MMFESKEDHVHQNNQNDSSDEREIEMQEYPLSVIAFSQQSVIHTNLRPINRKKYDITVIINA